MEPQSGSMTKTLIDKESQVRLHVNQVANVRKQMSSECLKLVEKNMQQELVNVEKVVILKPKPDTEQLMVQLNKPLSSYSPKPGETADVQDLFSMLKKLKEKNDDLLEVSKMLPKDALTKKGNNL